MKALLVLSTAYHMTLQMCFKIISVNLNCAFTMIAFVLSILCVILSLKEVVT